MWHAILGVRLSRGAKKERGAPDKREGAKQEGGAPNKREGRQTRRRGAKQEGGGDK